MNPWIAKALVLATSAVMIAIRAPHGQRSPGVKVMTSRKGPHETALLTLAMAGFVVPLLRVATPLFAFADDRLDMAPLVAGIVSFVAGLWLLHRAHADLGTNWSITLEVREQHGLVTHGVYKHIRHPIFTALFLNSIGQALAG